MERISLLSSKSIRYKYKPKNQATKNIKTKVLNELAIKAEMNMPDDKLSEGTSLTSSEIVNLHATKGLHWDLKTVFTLIHMDVHHQLIK